MEVWTSSDIKKEVIESKKRIKGKYKASRITRNKFGVYILWIDNESQRKMWCGKS